MGDSDEPFNDDRFQDEAYGQRRRVAGVRSCLTDFAAWIDRFLPPGSRGTAHASRIPLEFLIARGCRPIPPPRVALAARSCR